MRKVSAPSNLRREIAAGCLLILLTACAFWPVLNADFINFDDPEYIINNKNVQAGLQPASIRWAFTTFHASNWHPLTWLSLMLDCEIYGQNPHGYHATNLLLHIVNVLLLFAVLRMTTGMIVRSAVVAALFAVHPLHVESVAWIVERKDVLSTMFWLLTVAAYIHYARRPTLARYLIVVFLFACGLMSKPMLVTLPFTLFLLDYWPLRRVAAEVQDPRRQKLAPRTSQPVVPATSIKLLLAEKLPLLTLSAASCFITIQAQKSAMTALELPLHLRIMNALVAYVTYIFKMLWPVELSIFYPHPDAKVPIAAAAGAALVLLVITLGVLRTKHDRYWAVGWFWYLGTLVPVIGLIQVGAQANADRYTYVPLIGLFVALVWGISDWMQRRHYSETLLQALAVVSIAACALMCWNQSRYWIDGLTLWQHALDQDENNYQAHYSVAVNYAKHGQWEEAARHTAAAMRNFPPQLRRRLQLGKLLIEQGQVEAGIKELTQSLESNPRDANAHYELGTIWETQGKLDLAVDHFRQAVRIKPDFAAALNSLGLILMQRDEIAAAIDHFQSSLRADPADSDILHNLGIAFEISGRIRESLPLYQRAVDLEPKNANYRFSLGFALQENGDRMAAAREFQAGLELDPQWLTTAHQAAWDFATQESSPRMNALTALLLAQRMCAATQYQQASLLDTLAAASANLQRFEDAVKYAQLAAQCAASSPQQELRGQIRGRLQLYEAHKPFRANSRSR